MKVHMPELPRNTDEPLMTEDEVADYLRVKPSTVRTWVKQDKIPHVKAGSLNRFRREDIDHWTESQGKAPAAGADREAA